MNDGYTESSVQSHPSYAWEEAKDKIFHSIRNSFTKYLQHSQKGRAEKQLREWALHEDSPRFPGSSYRVQPGHCRTLWLNTPFTHQKVWLPIQSGVNNDMDILKTGPLGEICFIGAHKSIFTQTKVGTMSRCSISCGFTMHVHACECPCPSPPECSYVAHDWIYLRDLTEHFTYKVLSLPPIFVCNLRLSSP